nr:multicopper oxidase family protein [Ktedonobacteraceae bacterium]
MRLLLGLLCFLMVAGVTFGVAMETSRYPDAINMGTSCSMGNMSSMPNMDMSARCQAGHGVTAGIPVTSLRASQTAAHIDEFTLTAQSARSPLMVKGKPDVWTYNGTSPGPTLRVRQGDLVVVHLINHLSVGVTIHWHGVAVPNSADGVAGVTQDVLKPGQAYTYRFVAKDPGTYWYHSHQESFEQTGNGLYGMLIIEPARPVVHDDIDANFALHTWGGMLVFNTSTGAQSINARPGQWVRLRLLNTDNTPHGLVLLGAPFLVAALDGHDLNGPTPLTRVPISIDAAQRYDLRFQMPSSGTVALLSIDDNGHYQATPSALVGQGSNLQPPLPLPSIRKRVFDFTTYGRPTTNAISPNSHFDVTYTIQLGFTFGFSNTRPGPVFTLDGKAFPNTPTLLVKTGQLVRLRFVNDAIGGLHPMHLHGHTFTVLTKNGHPLTG